MPKLDLDAIPQTNATGYPAPFDEPVAGALVPPPRPAERADALRREPRDAEARRVVLAAALAREE